MRYIPIVLSLLAAYGCATTVPQVRSDADNSIVLKRAKIEIVSGSLEHRVTEVKEVLTFNGSLVPVSEKQAKCAYVQTGAEYLDCFGITPR